MTFRPSPKVVLLAVASLAATLLLLPSVPPTTDSKSFSIIGAETLGALYPGVTAPTLPYIATHTFTVADIAATRAVLAGNGVATEDGADGGLWVRPEHAHGSVISFIDGT